MSCIIKFIESRYKTINYMFISFLFVVAISFMLPKISLAQTIRVALKDIMQVENIRLQGIKDNTDKYEFKLSIPERWKVNQASFTFSYSHSSSLIKNKSRLVFSLDGKPLAQAALDPLSPRGDITVPISGRLLASGYHPFTFSAAQHSVEDNCEDPAAPELWTWVELSDAFIDFDFTLKPVPSRISAASDFLFDPKNPSAPSVNLIFQDNDQYLKAAGLAAAGIALRYDYRMVDFASSNSIQSGVDNVIIGDEKFLRSTNALEYFSANSDNSNNTTNSVENSEQVIKGPSLMLFSLKDDIYHSLIVITGRNPDEVLVAAKAFSLISLPLPDSSVTQIKDIQIPQIDPYTLKNGIEPGKTFRLSNLGFKTHTFEGISPIPKGFSFRLPSDTHLSPNSQAVLSLNMAYGASMREDSVLNIQLNDQFVAAVPCKDTDGGTYRNYKVGLLLSSMRAGYNKLTISPQLTPLITEQCTMIQTGNLRLTVFEDSTFTAPSVDNWIEMPNLKAFMSDAFPFGRLADMRETVMLLPDGKKSSVAAALNLIAIASQKIGFPPLGLEWRKNLMANTNLNAGVPDKEMLDKDIIVVSEVSAIPENISSAAPLNLSPSGAVSYPHLIRPKGYEQSEGKGFFSNLIPRKGSQISDISVVDSKIVVTRFEPLITKDKAVLMQFQSPFDRKRSVVMLTAGNENDMTSISRVLWRPEVQAACSGDTALINLTQTENKEFQTISLKLGSSYYLGGLTPLPFMEYYANTYPLWFIGVVILVCLSMALILYQMIKIRRKRRLDSNAQ